MGMHMCGCAHVWVCIQRQNACKGVSLVSPLDEMDDDDGKVQSNEQAKKAGDSDEEPSKFQL